jgi:hypothetical protein
MHVHLARGASCGEIVPRLPDGSVDPTAPAEMRRPARTPPRARAKSVVGRARTTGGEASELRRRSTVSSGPALIAQVASSVDAAG